MDFTLKIYRQLLIALQKQGYSFYTFEQYCSGMAEGKYVILRHDVDLKAGHSLATARVENKLGICASYYFRVVPQSNQLEIIRAIAVLGHEIGYHYEDMSLFNGNAEKAIAHFTTQLTHFRQFYPVKTICMHGSPTSKYDNKDLWKTYNYKEYGIIGEPYFDVDFNKMNYLTDTGRMWDGEKYSVRDKVVNSYQLTVDSERLDEKIKIRNYHSTTDIILSIQSGTFPLQTMITTHPQRWTDNRIEWIVELVMQSLKNVVKRLIIGSR